MTKLIFPAMVATIFFSIGLPIFSAVPFLLIGGYACYLFNGDSDE